MGFRTPFTVRKQNREKYQEINSGNGQSSVSNRNTSATRPLLNMEEIVISGFSGKFPESSSVQEFQKNLFDGVDMVTDDDRRWTPGLHGLPKRSGKLKELDKFDALYFNVHAKQAHQMDPQLRLLLELTHEAILDAGVNPSTIRGTRTGVFVGVSGSESETGLLHEADTVSGYSLTGCTRSMFANRISFTFDFKGPSFAVDTACSSSLLALQQAVTAIRLGDCDSAIVGGVHLCLSPLTSLQFHSLSMLSPEGKCKSFDASGNGYVRSEAAVALFIQRKSSARRSYATILHAKTSTDGYKEQGVTFPSGQEQSKLLEETYAEAGVQPNEVVYLEAHGTGTKIGDPQELNAVARVFCRNRSKDNPLLIGSVKSNIGHTEPASGLCGIAKVLLAMQTNVIPANLHYKTPNREIPALVDGRLEVVTENRPWNGGIVGVNSFGFGGCNVHVILRSNSRKQHQNGLKNLVDLHLPKIVPFSGRTKESVDFALRSSQNHPSIIDSEQISLLYEISKSHSSGHPHRGFSIVNNDQILDIQTSSFKVKDNTKQVWFIFSGMGSQWAGMGSQLSKFKACRESLFKSTEILRSKTKVNFNDDGFDLLEILSKGTEKDLYNVQNSFVTITAIQTALVDLLRSIGVEPHGIIGHSSGELAAAYADNCMTAEQTLLAAYYRGHAFLSCEDLANFEGGMAAVGLPWEEAKVKCPPGIIYPACHNAPDSVTVSGPKDKIKEFVEQLTREGIFAREVNSCGQAFHSEYIKPVGPTLKKMLQKVVGPMIKKRSSKWISSSVPEAEWGSELAENCSADYHVNNLLSPVLFQEALTHIPERDAVVIEIGPHCLLQAVLKRSLPNCDHIGLMNKNSGDQVRFLLNSLGQLFNVGLNPDFGYLYEKPEFPVSCHAASISSLVKWKHDESWKVVKCGSKTNGETTIEISLKNPADQFYAQHNIDGRLLFPASGYLYLAWQTFAKIHGKSIQECPVVFEHVKILRATVLPKDGAPVRFHLNLFEGTGEFQIREGDAVVGCGTVRKIDEKETSKEFLSLDSKNVPEFQEEKSKYLPLTTPDLYKEFRLRGYNYSGIFQGIQKADNEGNWARIEWKGNWVSFIDTIFQAAILCKSSHLHLPVGFERLALDPRPLLTQAKGQSDSLVLPVYHYKNIQVIQCEGIVEVRRWSTAMAPRKIQKVASNSLKLDRYEFSPYFDQKPGENDPSSYSSYSTTEKALRFCLGVVIENSRLLSIFKTVEISEKVENSQIVLINQILLDLCPQPCSLKLLALLQQNPAETSNKVSESNDNSDFLENNTDESDKNSEIVTNLEKVGVTVSLKESREELFSEFDGQFLILNGSEFFTQLQDSTIPNESFVLVYCDSDEKTVDLSAFEKHEQAELNLVLVSHKRSSDKQFYLFRKCSDTLPREKEQNELNKKESVQQFYNIEIKLNEAKTDFDYSWVEELKKILEQSRDESDSPTINLISREQSSIPLKSGIIGLVNCLRHEPGGHKIKCFFIKSKSKPINGCKENETTLLNYLDFSSPDAKLQRILKTGLLMNVFDDGVYGCYRHYPIICRSESGGETGESLCGLKETAHAYVNTLTRGDLSSFQWIESPIKDSQANSDVFKIHYAAINFRDVMISTGGLPLEALPGAIDQEDCLLGMEYSGTDSQGKRFMGIVNAKGLATSVVPNRDFLWDVPDDWAMSDAATVPVCYSTALYALIIRGQIHPGESILIHSGSGGVGQAAIALALHMNCTVYTTVGSKDKREFLKTRFPSLNDRNIANSRDTSFEQQIMEETQGRGVDLVLNSLAGDKLKASVKCLAQHGRFLEIGKLDLFQNSSLGMAIFLKNASVCGILLDAFLDPENQYRDKFRTIKLFKEGLASGLVQPLPSVVFEKDPKDIEKAFRLMASGKHIGKVVIKIRDESEAKTAENFSGEKIVRAIPRSYFDPSAVYIIVGGLGGFGLQLAGWLIERGARKISLVSRSGVTNGYQDFCLRKWRAQGVTIETPTVDLTTLENATKFLQNVQENDGPVKGIFNLAMALKDGLLENQKAENFQQVSKPKIQVTMALDQASRLVNCPSLEYFVVFSSLASGRGTMGLSTYAWANSSIEGIIECRVKAGLCGLAIQWGPIGDVGVLADHHQNSSSNDSDRIETDRTLFNGTVLRQRLESCLKTLDDFLILSQTQLDSSSRDKATKISTLSSYVIAPRMGSEASGESKSFSLVDCVCHILGLSTDGLKNILEPSKKLIELGMDSLMGAEIKQLIELRYGLALGPSEIIELTWGRLLEIQEGLKSTQETTEAETELPPSLPQNGLIHSAHESGKSQSHDNAEPKSVEKEIGNSDQTKNSVIPNIKTNTKKRSVNNNNNAHSLRNGIGRSRNGSAHEEFTKATNLTPPTHPMQSRSWLFLVWLYASSLGQGLLVLILLVISSILRKGSKLYLKLFNLESNIRVVDRPLDTFYAFNPRGSNMVFIVKCSGIPNRGKIVETLKKRVFDWETDISLEAHQHLGKGKKASKLYKPYENLQWKAVRRWLFYYWERDQSFQVENHVSLDIAPEGAKDLDKLAQKYSETYLKMKWDQNRPQWEVRIVQPKYTVNPRGGDKEKEFIILIVVSHVYGDAMSLLHMFQYTLADQKPPSPEMMQQLLNGKKGELFPMNGGRRPIEKRESWSDGEKLTTSLVFSQLVQLVKYYVNLYHDIIVEGNRMKLNYQESPPCSPIDQDDGRHCGALTINLNKFRGLQTSQGKPVPVTAIVLNCMAGAYAKIYQSAGKKVPDKVVTMMPFSMPFKRLGLINNFNFGCTTVYPRMQDPTERLDVTTRELEWGTSPERLNVWGYFFHKISQLSIPFMEGLSFLTPSPSMLYSNVVTALPPGVSIFGGHKILKLSGHTLISMKYHATMTSVVDSLANTVNLSLVVDNSAVAVSRDFIQEFFTFFQEELDQLTERSRQEA